QYRLANLPSTPRPLLARRAYHSTSTAPNPPHTLSLHDALPISYSANDSLHTNSSDTAGYALTVTTRATTTQVTSCSPNPTALNQARKCTLMKSGNDSSTYSVLAWIEKFATSGSSGVSGTTCRLE